MKASLGDRREKKINPDRSLKEEKAFISNADIVNQSTDRLCTPVLCSMRAVFV